MTKTLNFIFIITISLLTHVAQAAITVKDDKGNIVTLSQPAKRIISLAPHITETLFAAGAGSKIVGVVSYSDYPEAAKKIIRVGGYPSLDVEKIISLNPDLIIAWASGNNAKQIEKLSALGFPVFLSEPLYPLDIAKSMQRFGELAGTKLIANKIADEFLQHYQLLKQQFATKEKVKVFYQIWNKPIMTISDKHLISKIIELCGGENVFAGINSLTPRISMEAVLSSQAEIIISGGMGKPRPDWIEEWRAWQQLPAVRNEQLYFIDPDLMQRVGPRILQGADRLCEMLEKARKKS